MGTRAKADVKPPAVGEIWERTSNNVRMSGVRRFVEILRVTGTDPQSLVVYQDCATARHSSTSQQQIMQPGRFRLAAPEFQKGAVPASPPSAPAKPPDTERAILEKIAADALALAGTSSVPGEQMRAINLFRNAKAALRDIEPGAPTVGDTVARAFRGTNYTAARTEADTVAAFEEATRRQADHAAKK